MLNLLSFEFNCYSLPKVLGGTGRLLDQGNMRIKTKFEGAKTILRDRKHKIFGGFFYKKK